MSEDMAENRDYCVRNCMQSRYPMPLMLVMETEGSAARRLRRRVIWTLRLRVVK